MLSMLCRIHVRDSVNDHNIDNCNKLLEIVIGVKKIVEMLMIQKQDNTLLKKVELLIIWIDANSTYWPSAAALLDLLHTSY